jgi:hypothetical protein
MLKKPFTDIPTDTKYQCCGSGFISDATYEISADPDLALDPAQIQVRVKRLKQEILTRLRIRIHLSYRKRVLKVQ